MARILVTGGSGFIGKEIVYQLLNRGHEINILDLYWKDELANVTYFKGSVADKIIVSKAVAGCDYVVHLAAILGVANSTRNPLECLDVNINGTRNVLECSVIHKVKKVVFSSSSEVYGEPLSNPISEDTVRQPKSEYGVSKVVGEEYVKAFCKEHGLNYGMVRFFNVYGPEQLSRFVVPIFIDKALSNQPVKVYGEGNQVRSFCYVEDSARGLIEVLFNQEANQQVFNIGNSSNEISMLELAKLVLRIAGKSEEPVCIPIEDSDRTREREIFRRIPDTSKAARVINFEAKIGLEEGIKRVIDYKLNVLRKDRF